MKPSQRRRGTASFRQGDARGEQSAFGQRRTDDRNRSMVLLDHDDLYALLDVGQHAMEVARHLSLGHVNLRHRFDRNVYSYSLSSSASASTVASSSAASWPVTRTRSKPHGYNSVSFELDYCNRAMRVEKTHLPSEFGIWIPHPAPSLLLLTLATSQLSTGSYPHRAGEQYGHIEGAKMAQVIPIGPNLLPLQVPLAQTLLLISNHLAVSISSPEKAGVGGSIPSLATMFSISYRPSESRLHSKTLVRWDLLQRMKWLSEPVWSALDSALTGGNDQAAITMAVTGPQRV